MGRIAVTNFHSALYPYLCTQIRLMQNIFKYLEPKFKFPRKIVFLSNSANTFRAVVFFSFAVIIFFFLEGNGKLLVFVAHSFDNHQLLLIPRQSLE